MLQRVFIAEKVTVGNDAFHIPYLNYPVDAMYYFAYATYPYGVNPLINS